MMLLMVMDGGAPLARFSIPMTQLRPVLRAMLSASFSVLGVRERSTRTNVNGKVYHPDCFRCTACHEKFTSNKFQVKDGEFYDYECYKQLFHPRFVTVVDFV
ncbi:hypothetical protein DD238_003622 [Peronospora effusa]|uniref:LIM zinc-binding domain-containing protein n=1 Tax=Peronospora effusa TaxID=542832 RepID=A0A3M6VFE2_9STRA|nr:hypothetical protein DD238_003622 [Peronospora effusa]